MESPDIIIPGLREYETEVYPEHDGVIIYPYTTHEAFEYTCKFLYMGTLEQLNNSIWHLWNELFDTYTAETKRAKETTLYNDYKAVKVVGYPQAMTGEDFKQLDPNGLWETNFTIYVADPSKCVWSSTAGPENPTP
jgi:hypothetical protein